jgi:hypothetical protein
MMTEPRSFRISDFSIRDVPWAAAAYVIISLSSIALGAFLESLPKFWSGLLLGAGCGLFASFFLFRPVKKDIYNVMRNPG